MLIDMNMGGTEKAFLNFINELSKKRYSITLLLLENQGMLLDQIPKHVEVKYVKNYHKVKELYQSPPLKSLLNLLRKTHIRSSIHFGFVYLILKFFNNKSLYMKYILKNLPNLTEDYDTAVAFAGPMDIISYYVIEKIKAKQKIQWIHFDVSKIGFNKKSDGRTLKRFDKVIVVSKEGKEKLVNLVPSIKQKTFVFYNVLRREYILEQAKSGPTFSDEFTGLRILTVGRITHEKGIDIAIHALSKLVKMGYKVKWYCVGDGPSINKYTNLVKRLNLESSFIFLGSCLNPYNYLFNCDIYVQPSRHEGYCITLAEAICLEKPIITTGFTGAKEQIDNGVNGLIADEDIHLSIVKLIEDEGMRKTFSKKLSVKRAFEDNIQNRIEFLFQK
ncbi:glycosyltransferase [Bacillus sp. RO2]|uniref:glycosyltransferase n=1 Tax=Bacillus sp. RO2 TaxID=2723913 RepID=UPI001F0D12E1|nr:glycosyltransferase [Bacillus sp. RO2]